jgi:hypothetical protein
MAQDEESPRLRLYLDDAAAVDDLFRQAFKAKGNGALSDFLNFLAQFPRYSLFNAMLIRLQRPGAMAVASRHRWLENGHFVASDAVPIIILQPFGPVQFVYDIGDTHGPPLPEGGVLGLFGAAGDFSGEAWDKAVSAAAKCGIVIELVANYGAALAGTSAVLHRTDLGSHLLSEKSGGVRFRIKINSRLNEPARFATLAHELGHIYCGHQGGDSKDRWSDRSGRKLTRGQRELEAEAVSWLVCRRLGLETRSAEYLSDYVELGDLERISTFVITAAAHRIEAWRQSR